MIIIVIVRKVNLEKHERSRPGWKTEEVVLSPLNAKGLSGFEPIYAGGLALAVPIHLLLPRSHMPIVVAVGALHTGSDRGLVTDVRIGEMLGLTVRPVCTSIVAASHNQVTDVTEVPSDTVDAQLAHLVQTEPLAGVKVGVLGDWRTAALVLDRVVEMRVPVVMDVVASGPNGETVLTGRGIDMVAGRLGAADLVTISRRDATLLSGGEISSLDDAQVAAQRIHHRGAQAVLIRCGALPYRFYDAVDDPGASGDAAKESPPPFFFDLFYDGRDFALFEAPLLPDDGLRGACDAFAMAVVAARVLDGAPLEKALQHAKRITTEAIRRADLGAASPRLIFRS